MRRNLLTFVFVLSLVIFGIGITNAEASNGSLENTTKSNNVNSKVTKQMSRSELVTKFNKTISQFKENCIRNWCDDMIEKSVVVADEMIAACDYAEESHACKRAQEQVYITMETTLYWCSKEGPTALNKKDFIRKNNI